MLPVVLYSLNMPNGGFSADYMKNNMNSAELDSGTVAGRSIDNAGMRIDKSSGSEYLSVAALSEGGPASKAGLQVNDLLLSLTRSTDADGKPLPAPETIDLKGMPLDEVTAKLRGKPATSFTLAVERPGGVKQNLEVTRAAEAVTLNFKELDQAALSAQARSYFSGKIGVLTGQFLPGKNDRMFSLARIRIKCCAADTTTLNVVIILGEKVPTSVLTQFKQQEWVQVQGEIQFRKRKDRDEYAAVMVVHSAADIKETDPDPNFYLQ
jgi:hypothetical protein